MLSTTPYAGGCQLQLERQHIHTHLALKKQLYRSIRCFFIVGSEG